MKEKAQKKDPKVGLMTTLMRIWGQSKIFDVAIILIVFAATGTSVLWLKYQIYHWFDLGTGLSLGGRILFFLGITLPLYQTLLLFYGFLFGKFHFFWQKEVRFFQGIGQIFNRKKAQQ
jgi:hypothetical protein